MAQPFVRDKISCNMYIFRGLAGMSGLCRQARTQQQCVEDVAAFHHAPLDISILAIINVNNFVVVFYSYYFD